MGTGWLRPQSHGLWPMPYSQEGQVKGRRGGPLHEVGLEFTVSFLISGQRFHLHTKDTTLSFLREDWVQPAGPTPWPSFWPQLLQGNNAVQDNQKPVSGGLNMIRYLWRVCCVLFVFLFCCCCCLRQYIRYPSMPLVAV